MSLFQLIFGRRSRVADSVAFAKLQSDTNTTHAAETSFVGVPVLTSRAKIPRAAPKEAAPEPLVRALRIAASPPIVLRRVSSVTLEASATTESRQAAVLAWMEVVHDPNTLLILGADRSAQILIANRRVMAARFHKVSVSEQAYNFRHEAATVDEAIDCVRAIADLLADPVELVIKEDPANGVFCASGGFAVEDAFFDEEICRAALRQALRSGDAMDCPQQTGNRAQQRANHPVPTPVLILQRHHAFAEDAPAFVTPQADRREA